jgi:vacuolar protein-sorting-associated protein 4
MRHIFEIAKERKPAIIFIDEIDALSPTRDDSESESSRRILTEILVQMTSIHGTSGIIVMAATNVPWDLSTSILRRFTKKIFVPMMQKKARSDLIKFCLSNSPNSLTKMDLDTLAESTDGYTSSDINVLVRDASMQEIRHIQHGSHFKKVKTETVEVLGPSTQEFKYEHCPSTDPDAIEIKWSDIPPEQLGLKPVTIANFEEVLATHRPSVTETDLKKFEEYNATLKEN